MPAPTLPTVSVATSIPKDADVVILGIGGTPSALRLVGGDDLAKPVMNLYGRSLAEVVADLGGCSKADCVTVVPSPTGSTLVATGLGDADPTPEQVRMAVGAAARKAVSLGDRIAIDLELTDPEMIQAAVEGALLGSHSITKITGDQPTDKASAVSVVVAKASADVKAAVERGRTVAEGVCLARDWVNVPANLLYPETFAADATAVAKGTKVSVDVLDEKALTQQGFGGILAVGGGSDRPPRLTRYTYAPRGAKFHLGLVGKGITFDTGGLDLKTADGMYTMKCDMGGAAAVLAATRAIAQLGLPIKVTTYAAMAENMPSGSAYRPSDVLTMYGGKTVENANSDAEGRLVMADAIARLDEDKPDLIIDVATLTGACMVALGNRCAGLMGSDDEAVDRILDAAEAAGEEFWQLPIPSYVVDGLESKIADIKSSGARQGGALAAGAFLHEFVSDGRAWAHMDIAGPAFNSDAPYGYVPVGGTGSAVRTLVALAQHLSK